MHLLDRRMSMKHTILTSLLSAVVIGSAVCAADFSPAKTLTAASYAKKAPVVDGKISPDEYAGGFEQFGVLQLRSGQMSSRQAKFFAALDNQYLYLACQSELPDPGSGVRLKNRYKKRDSFIPKDDNIEFLVFPPDADALYHFIINPANVSYDVKYPVVNGGVSPTVRKDWNPAFTAKSGTEGKYWTLEVKIPLKDLNVKPTRAPAKWLFQFARSWKNPAQQSSFNKASVFADPEQMNPVIFSEKSSAVRFTSMGNYDKGENAISFTIDNPGTKPVKVKYHVAVLSEAAPRSISDTVTVPAGTSKSAALNYTEKANVTSEMTILFTEADTGKVLLQRCLSWQYPVGPRWIAPEVKAGIQLEIGVYPYYKLIRARLGNHGVPLDLRKVKSAVMRITDATGKPVGKDYIPVKNGNDGYYAEMPLPKLGKGNYFVEARLKNQDGKETVYKTKFFFNTYEWEHNSIGKDRIVLPPYKALVYDKNTVRTLMSRYTLGNGFFSEISTGKAEKLLAAPIILNVNGKSLTGNELRWTEQAKDQGCAVQKMNISGLTISTESTIEFDNFVKTVVTVKPEKEFKFDSMTLEIPLRSEFARRIHATCNTMRYNIAAALPEKQGELWNSAQGKLHGAVSNNFRPYIWIGDLAEGLAFFAESDKNWSRDPAKPMAQLIRNGDTTVLRINFIDKPAVRKAPFTLTFGFQATPTRTRPNSSRQLTERSKLPNSVTMSLLAGGGCWSCQDYDFYPKDRDYTFIHALRKVREGKLGRTQQTEIVKKFMKHFASFPKDRQGFYFRHLERGFAYARNSNLLIPYMNSRATHLRWEEYNVFMDEWFCSDFRANNEDDYNNTPTASYQDFLLFCARKLIREGLDGIYYDNIRDWHNPNPVTGPAYRMESGKVQPYFDIFDMRTLIKRTAVMLHQEGKNIFDGRPLFVLHMTNTNLVPFTSLGSIALDWEDKYGAMDFQDRFAEDYIKVCSLGLQSGAIPEVLVQITGNNREHVTRTFLSVTLAYDLPMVLNGGGLTPVFSRTWKTVKQFGYGTDEVKTFPCFSPSGRFTTGSKDIRLTEYRKKDGTAILAVCSFGHEGKTVLGSTVSVKEARDIETGKSLPVKDNSVEIELKKNEFKLIQFK